MVKLKVGDIIWENSIPGLFKIKQIDETTLDGLVWYHLFPLTKGGISCQISEKRVKENVQKYSGKLPKYLK